MGFAIRNMHPLHEHVFTDLWGLDPLYGIRKLFSEASLGSQLLPEKHVLTAGI